MTISDMFTWVLRSIDEVVPEDASDVEDSRGQCVSRSGMLRSVHIHTTVNTAGGISFLGKPINDDT